MHGQRATTLWASPPGFFLFDELPYPPLLDIFEVFNHAHAIIGPVSLVDMRDHLAWIMSAAETKSVVSVGQVGAILNFAPCARFCFVVIITPATRAGLPLPDICHA